MLPKKTNKQIFAALSLAVLITPFAFVNAEGDRKGPPGGAPSEEALSACADLTEGAACSFSSDNDALVEGSCKAPPHGGNGPLACVPARGKGGPRPEGPKDLFFK